MKNLKQIPFTDLENIPLLIKDFLKGNILDFKEEIFNLENVGKKIQPKENLFSDEKRNILYDVLKVQLQNLSLTSLQSKNLEALKENNVFTITTGHQLNLFSGPVFFIYKILQTIKTATYLTKHFPDARFVPMFWMATEDHDFEEINHFKTDQSFYEIAGKAGGPVGKVEIESTEFISVFEEEFKDAVYGQELISLMKTAYNKGNNLADATKIIVHHLFSEYGLLIIDGDDVALKKQMISVFEDELLNQSLKKYSAKKVEYLENKYGKVQVNPREINLFYLSETRNRIEFLNNEYQIVDTEIRFSKEEMLAELKNFPERFSPNALMRPVFQEFILPNIAYIGGNAEIMYWLELKDYFEKIELEFPILIPRNSFLMLHEKTVEKISNLHLEINDIFKNINDLSKEVLLEDNAILKQLDQVEIQLAAQFSQLKSASENTDITFGNLVDAEKTRQLKSFNRMKKRLLRAEKIKQHELLERLENLFSKIHPAGIWQERVYNFSIYYANEGKSWLQFCLDEMPVQNPSLVIAQV